MKKFIKYFLLFILIIFVILLTAPFVFKGKILKIANEQLDKNLNAHASFSDLNISLIRNFPNLSIRLKGLNVTGIEEFEDDTLINVKAFGITLDLLSAIKMENVIIKQITIDKPYINAIILKDGNANWDIAKEPTEEETPEDTATTKFNTKISLKLFEISNAVIKYTDNSSGMSSSLDNFNFRLTGDLSQDFTTIVIDSRTDKVNFYMDGIRYLRDVVLQMHFDVDANLKESIYVLNKNEIALNNLTLTFDGSVEMPESGDIITNLTFGTNNADFKTLLSLVPAIFTKDYADLQTSGKLKLDGKVSGKVTETSTPDVDAKLLVTNASFKYPALPKSAENINIDIIMHYDGKQMDNTTVDVNKFHVDLGGNPIDLVMNLRTPISDPFTNGNLAMSLDLESLSDVIPLDSTELKGKILANLDWMGKLSSIENEKYEEFKADGHIAIDNFYYNSPDLPEAFSLNTARLSFSPRQITLSSFDAKLGASDFRLQGKVTNYIPFVLKDETITGELALNSNQIDLNEFMTDEAAPAETPEADTTPMTVVEVPGNIDFRFSSSIGKVLYDKMTIANLSGVIIIKDKKVVMGNLKMNMLDGTVALSGEYNTQDLANPFVDVKFNATNIDIPMTVEAFSSVAEIVPVASNATGNVSLNMSLNTFLDQDMSPVMKSVQGKGVLASNQIGLKSNSFKKVGEALKTKAFDNMVLKNLEIKFEIIDGSIYVDPFETKMGDATMTIAGKQSIDQSIDYGINMSIPRKMLGLENAAVDNLYSGAASKGLNIPKSENVNIMAKVTGTVTDPAVSLDLKENAKQATQVIKEEIKREVKEVIETKKEDVKAQARAEADKIMKEAEQQADKVRSEAKKAADVVRSEANTNADKVMNEAKNSIAKAAAKPTADKMRSEGEKKAQGIEKEADIKANKILQEAKIKSDNLLK